MSLETGKIGRQADGAVVARSGDTIVYSTACYQKEESEVDFTPLRVDYFARFRYGLTDTSDAGAPPFHCLTLVITIIMTQFGR